MRKKEDTRSSRIGTLHYDVRNMIEFGNKLLLHDKVHATVILIEIYMLVARACSRNCTIAQVSRIAERRSSILFGSVVEA